MIKKITISMMICVTLFLSVQQSYVKASSSIASNSAEVLRGAWQSVVMGIAAAGAAGLQTKQIIDDNRDALVAKAGAAWDKMSVESQRVFGQALDAGRLGASQTYNELYGAIEGVFDDVYGSKAIASLPYKITSNAGTVTFSMPGAYNTSQGILLKASNDTTYILNHSNTLFRFTLSCASPSVDTVLYTPVGVMYKTVSSLDAQCKSINAIKTIGDMSSFLSGYSTASGVTITTFAFADVATGLPVDDLSIYDQALKRAKEQDIPKMIDAGLVLPQPTITGAQGQKLKYDAQNGTLVLPDGSIYTGDATWSYPKPTIGVNKNPVWQDTATGQDTDIWTGDKTDTITGNPAIPDTGVGEGTDSPTITTKLDKILEGVRAIPDAIVTGITTIFVPTATPTAFSNMIKQFTGLLVLPSFAWLTNSDLACSRVQDVKVTIMGKSLTIVSLDFVMQAKSFYMPIMRGFLWFLFGWYAYKKIIAMINKVDGVSQ